MSEKLQIYALQSWLQVKAMSDPIRLHMMQLMVQRDQTPLALAEALGIAKTAIYHHIEALLTAGLIRVVAEQKKRGCIEKTYRAVADRFQFDRNLLQLLDGANGGQEDERGLLVANLEAVLAELRAKGDESPLEVLMNLRFQVRMSASSVERFRSKILALVEEARNEDSGERPVTWVLAGFSTTTDDEKEDSPA